MTEVKLDVLTPENSQTIFIDHQPQMAYNRSIARAFKVRSRTCPFCLSRITNKGR
ncbi:MAG: hypothetical protein ABSC06_17560 [Rhodopila sp.]